jgi:hypothetical protein
MMAAVTRTLGPLHLEDLEPHRFEDLVRQLLYDFRPWRDLEATGRTGSDEGFDARATEMTSDETDVVDDEDDSPPTVQERQWLIQCKREKAIGPKKLRAYLDGLPNAAEAGLYGLIFAAACDFSIEARDGYYRTARELGFQEAKLWGKAEIEDQLFQPKNDHLLFAYFGVSLQARRRSVKTEVRARLAMKRKAKRSLQSWMPVLCRDAEDDRYPYLDKSAGEARAQQGRWRVYEFDSVSAFGLVFKLHRHLAFIDDDGIRWDYAERMDDGRPNDDPWAEEDAPEAWTHRSEDMRQWDSLEEKNRAWYEHKLVLPFEHIIDIDPDGDEFFPSPHIYIASMPPSKGPFTRSFELETIGHSPQRARPDSKTRVHFFPRVGEQSDFKIANRVTDDMGSRDTPEKRDT